MRQPKIDAVKSLRDRLTDGESVLVAEGYLFELERRGLLQSGAYVPLCVLDHPTHVALLHEEFAHAGSDVIQALTYCGNRERLRLAKREEELEALNRRALRMARAVADEEGRLAAACVSNTAIFKHDDPQTYQPVQAMFREQVQWAVEEGADMIIGETFTDVAEARLALRVMRDYAPGLDAVITFTKSRVSELTRDGRPLAEACEEMENMGATVTGLNCSTGPEQTLASQPAFPLDLDAFVVTQGELANFGRACRNLNIQYIGLCCGNCPRYFRALAEGPTIRINIKGIRIS